MISSAGFPDATTIMASNPNGSNKIPDISGSLQPVSPLAQTEESIYAVVKDVGTGDITECHFNNEHLCNLSFYATIFVDETLKRKAEMSRLSIELSPEQHQQVKALAALSGSSIRNYVLARLLPSSDEEVALKDLEALLDKRLKAAETGAISQRTVQDIFQDVYHEMQP